MKLARASQDEIDRLMSWLQAREKAVDAPPSFMRIVFGYETLIQNCCDQTKDYLDFLPGTSPTEVKALNQLLIEARSALIACGCKDDDLMNRLRAEISPPPDQGQAQIEYRD